MKAWIHNLKLKIQEYRYKKAFKYVMKHNNQKHPIRQSDFSCTEFYNCDFSQAIFHDCTFHGVNFTNSNLSYSDLSKAITKRIQHNWVENNVHKDKLWSVLNNDITGLANIAHMIHDGQLDEVIRELEFIIKEREKLKESQVYFR